MNTVIAFLFCLVSTNPMVLDKPEMHVDGYIEVNHFWQESPLASRNINGVDVYYGLCTFDQVLVKKYNKKYNRFDVVHAMVTTDGRPLSELEHKHFNENNVAKKEALDLLIKEEKAKVYDVWLKEHKRVARENKVAVDDIIVYVASEWTGPKSLINKPTFNYETGRYEVFMRAKPNDADLGIYKFTALSLYETNTTFDPEIESAGEQGKTVKEISFFGYTKKAFEKANEKRLKSKLQQPPWPIINFGFQWLELFAPKK